MPPQAAVAPAGAQPGQQQQQGGLKQLLGTLIRFGVMWYVMNMFKGNQQQAGKSPADMSAPLYRKGDLLDMYVYVSEAPYLESSQAELIWSQTEVGLATTADRKFTWNYTPSEDVKNNGTLFAHVLFARSGVDPFVPAYEVPPDSVFSKSHSLISFLPRLQNKTGVNLLSEGGNITTQKPEEVEREWIGYYKPNLTIAMVDHFQAYPKNGIPPPVASQLLLNPDGQQYPLVYFDDFWLLRDKLIPMNDTVEGVPLHVALDTYSFWWMQLQQQMDQSFQMQINTGLAQDGEADEVKRIFLEGNPYLLGLTMFVSLLHTVFDFLAFKNDIGFWKENKSMEGLSARSIVINAFCQLVIFLYLLDSETSMVVLLSAGVGTAIEFWKVTKAMDVSLKPSFPYINIKDRATYSNNPTKEYDRTAMRYLSYVLYPLVIGYSIYSLVYKTHKSWYSWILSSLVGAVYMFGFILMCPQLYLNYKLKSVAHLPWRQMTYKFLNTIIDDLFAFVIKMPTLHRLSVFRDDIVFLIYLYQRWIYRVDMTRVNEFGFSGQQSEDAAASQQQQPTLEGEETLQLEAADGHAGEEAAEASVADGTSRRRKPAAKQEAAEEADANGTVEADDSKKGQ
eukprot:gene11130-11284_t